MIAQVNQLIFMDHGAGMPDLRRVATKRLERIEAKLAVVTSEVTKLSTKPDDKCIVCQWEERLCEIKQELSDVAKSPIMLDLDAKDALLTKQTNLESCIFDNSLSLKRVLSEILKLESSRPSTARSIKLPKIDILSFNGDVIGWRAFWEQFNVSAQENKA